MDLIKRTFELPNELVFQVLDYLDFEYYEYHFYRRSKNKRRQGMVIIKYPLYRYFTNKEEDTIGFLAVKGRKPRANTI